MVEGNRRAAVIEPRGLSRTASAAYVGVSPTLFDDLVEKGRMPSPKQINRRLVWDRRKLDEAFEQLPDKDEENPWNEIGANRMPRG